MSSAHLGVEIVEEDLWGEVLEGADDALLVEASRGCGGAAGAEVGEVVGQAEVREDAGAGGAEEDVAGFDVAVHEASFVHGLETRGHAEGQVEHLGPRRPPPTFVKHALHTALCWMHC